MAHVIVSNIVSLDGYFEGPTKGVMDLPMDAAFDAYNRERITAAGTVVLGRRSYEMFGGYWPHVQHQPQLPPEDPMSQLTSEDNRAISRRYDEVGVLVVSDSLTLTDDAPWRAHTTVTPRADARAALDAIDGECVVFGSRTTWNALWRDGLVDEVHLMVGPVALGGGTPVFDEPTGLVLHEVRRFDGSSNVLLTYTPQESDQAHRAE